MNDFVSTIKWRVVNHLKGCPPKEEKERFIPSNISISEQSWMDKLKKLDDEHSKNNQITPEDFEAFLGEVETSLKNGVVPKYCENKEMLLECLMEYPACILRCQRYMDEFADCIDAVRVRRIKEVIKEEQRKGKQSQKVTFNT